MNELKQLNKNQLLKILAVLVLSDGHLYVHNGKPKNIRLITSGFGQDQHKLFEYLCLRIFGRNVRRRGVVRKITKQKCILSDLNYKGISMLFRLSPEYKTTPGKSTKIDYLNDKQPTLNFVFNDDVLVKWLALRTYFDFDGSISPTVKLKFKRDKKGNKVYEYFQVQFECEIKISETNPSLVNDLKLLCKQLGLIATIKKDKRNWSGISGICISELNSVKNFLERGGPITNVEVSGKSNRFKGVTKKLLCKNISNLLQDKSFKLSKSFKSRDEALKHQNQLNKFILERLGKIK